MEDGGMLLELVHVLAALVPVLDVNRSQPDRRLDKPELIPRPAVRAALVRAPAAAARRWSPAERRNRRRDCPE